MTLKDILNQVLSECGFSESPQFFNAQNSDINQLIALAQRSARVLSKHDWQALRKTASITLTSAEYYDLPSDFRQTISDTMWMAGRADKPDFPASDTSWGYVKARGINNSLHYSLRLEGNQFAVLSPVVGEVVSYDYLSNNPIIDIDTITSKPRWAKDTDTWLLDDDLIQMDLIWRFKKLKGLQDWQIDHQDFQNHFRSLQGTDSGSQSINTISNGTHSSEPIADLWVS